MFSAGEKIVYGQTGVCVIEDIAEKELIKNQKRLYYVLKPLNQQNNIIYAPADSDKIFIRPVMTREEAEKLILQIPEIVSKIKQGVLSVDDYREKLSSRKSLELVELTAIIYEKKKIAKSNKKKLGFSDEKYMHIAENMLFGELAVSLDIPIEQVPGYIENKLKNL